jgi:hypothetical protein
MVTLLGSLGVHELPRQTIESYYEGKFLMYSKATVTPPAAAQVQQLAYSCESCADFVAVKLAMMDATLALRDERGTNFSDTSYMALPSRVHTPEEKALL